MGSLEEKMDLNRCQKLFKNSPLIQFAFGFMQVFWSQKNYLSIAMYGLYHFIETPNGRDSTICTSVGKDALASTGSQKQFCTFAKRIKRPFH
ncbi:MAG: hypothetical protein AAFZ15_16695 [Bacteroidota bacterium]